jgi:hypothetical protein
MKTVVFKPNPGHHCEQQQELDTEFDNITQNGTQGHNQPGEIYFAKNTGIGHKGAAGRSEAGTKVIPKRNPTHVK